MAILVSQWHFRVVWLDGFAPLWNLQGESRVCSYEKAGNQLGLPPFRRLGAGYPSGYWFSTAATCKLVEAGWVAFHLLSLGCCRRLVSPAGVRGA